MTVIYPGSFDPVTNGHLDIIRRAVKFASRLIIALPNNPHKKTLFSAGERIAFIKDGLKIISEHEPLPCECEIEAFDGLLSEYAIEKNADVILRGVRTSADFEHENKYAAANARLTASFGRQIETIFLPASPDLSYVSSTIIREAAAHIYKNGADDSFLTVPPLARDALKLKNIR